MKDDVMITDAILDDDEKIIVPRPGRKGTLLGGIVSIF